MIYVDFTAKWCITCQSNKRWVINSKKIQNLFAQHEVVFLEADWTRRDPNITKILNSYGRAGVPLNIFYGPQPEQEIILPAVLTQNEVENALQKLLEQESP